MSNHTPAELLRFLEKMVEIARLNAPEIDRECIGEAIRLYLSLPEDWTPIPCCDGGVQLERQADGFDYEFSISRASRRNS